MSEEKILETLEDEKEFVEFEKKKFTFKGFFKEKRNIYALIAVILGLAAIIVFLASSTIAIDLTPEGIALAENNVDTIPEFLNYGERLNGAAVTFGVGSYGVWINQETSAYYEIQNMSFNAPIFIGLLFVLAGVVAVVVMTLLNKANFVNKIILGLFIVGALFILFAPIWFYAVNPIIASSRYDTRQNLAPYGSINAHGSAGLLVSAILGIGASVFSGLLIVKPVETR